LPTCHPDPGTQLGVVEPAGDRGGKGIFVAGPTLQHRVAVGAGDLGERAAVGGDQWCAAAHRFDGWQAEALVQAGHDGHLGLGVELDDAFVADARHELDVRGEAVGVDEVHRVAGAGLADDRERHVAFGPQLGHGFQQVRQPLEGDVGRCGGDQAPGPAGDVVERLEEVGIDTDRHEAHPVDADAHVGVDVVDRVLAHHDDARQFRGDLALHLHERVPPAHGQAARERLRVAHLELTVLGDRVVQRDDRGDLRFDLQDAVAEALIVVDQVELTGARLEFTSGARTERERLGEHPGHERSHLEEVFAGLQFPESGEPTGEVVVEGVEAGQLRERDALVEDRVRLATEHFDTVTQIGKGFGEVAGVDALAADMGFATVGEVCDLERGIRIETGFRHPSEAIGAPLPPGSAVPGDRGARDHDHHVMVIVRPRGVPGSTMCAARLSASGGPDWGSTQVASDGWS